MSYDMSIGDDDFNYTYNVADMWYAAIPKKGIRAHYGMTGEEALKPLTKIYSYMVVNSNELRKLEPKNGWGSFDGALDFVHGLISASLRNKDKIWDGD